MILDDFIALEKDVSAYLRLFIAEKDKYHRKSEKARLAKKLMKLKKRLDRSIPKLEEKYGKATVVVEAPTVEETPEVVLSAEPIEKKPQEVVEPIQKTPVVKNKEEAVLAVSKEENSSSGMSSEVEEESSSSGMGDVSMGSKKSTNSSLGNEEVVGNEQSEEVAPKLPTIKEITKPVGHKGKNIKEEVEVIQLLLNENGASLEVDGVCGNATIRAIAKFQKFRLGFEKQDGRVDPGGKTMEGLNKGAIKAAEPKSIANSVGENGKNAKVDAKIIQRLLRRNGAKISVDGVCGKGTIGAIKAFQKDTMGMETPTGLVEPDDETLDALNAKPAKVEAEVVVETETEVETEIKKEVERVKGRDEEKGVKVNKSSSSANKNREAVKRKDQINQVRTIEERRKVEENRRKEREEREKELESIASDIAQSLTGAGKAEKESYKYYAHRDYEKSTYYLGEGRTAKPLNALSARLLRNILAGAGISKAKVTSTFRTYSDQAYIVLTQVTRTEAYDWYKWVRNYSDVFEKYLAEYKSGKDQEQIFDEYGAWIEENIGLGASNHLSGIAIDIADCDLEAFNDFAKTLVPITGSGVRKVFPEKGRTHIEFMFKVC